MKKSISTRLLAITLSASIAGMGLIAAISMLISGTSLLKETLGKISENTAREAMRINDWMENQETRVLTLATDLSFQKGYSSETLMPLLTSHLSANAQYFDVYMGYPDGTGCFATGWIPDYASGWASYKRDWYAGAAQNPDEPYITSLYADSQTGSLCTTVSKAVVQSGAVVGVAAADVVIDVLTKIVNETSVGENSYAFLTDANGNLLIHPNAAYGPDKDDNFQNISQIENGLYKPMWENTAKAGESYQFKGKDGISRYYTMHEISTTGWRLYTAIPAAVVQAPITRLLYIVIPVFVAVLLLAALLIFLTIKRQIVRPIKAITGAAQALASGNTDISLEGRYEGELRLLRDSFVDMAQSTREQVNATCLIAAGRLDTQIPVRSDKDVMGNALNALSDNLNDIMDNIHQSSMRVSGGAEQIAMSSQALAQGAMEQAQAVQSLSSSINEIAAKIHSNLDKTAQANDVSGRINQNARNGMVLMEQMVAAVTQINDASANISKVIKTIEDIAFQTNILALNAAVEAARAGQQGKGFAVVAEEVRNLASKSASAAQESAALIQNSINKASDGARIAQQTSHALETVISGIDESVALIGQIAAAANEENAAIMYINQGVDQVSQVVSSNTATSEETAASAQELTAEANGLRSAISSFTLSVEQ